MRLPQGRLEELKQLIAKRMARKAGKKRNILSLIGKLAHAAKIIVSGHIFLMCMIDMAHKAKQLDHWIHLTTDFKSNLAWWQCFIDYWNGLSIIRIISVDWSPVIYLLWMLLAAGVAAHAGIQDGYNTYGMGYG